MMTTWPETQEIIEALNTLNNPVINAVIESYELAVDDLNAYHEVLNDYSRDEPEDIEARNSIQSGINYRTKQTSAMIPILRKFYRLFYLEKQSTI